LLARPGLINVDFADLCAVTQGKHGESAIATAEAKGENRAREVLEKLMAHPLIEGGQTLSESAGVLICIAGGPEMSMAEVNRIMEQINRQCEQAHLILGAAVDEQFRERLLITLIASGKQSSNETAALSSVAVGRHPLAPPDLSSASVPIEETLTLGSSNSARPPSRFVPPPPALTAEKREQLISQHAGNGPRHRKHYARPRQGQLPLEIVSKGRFEKSEPTIHHGQDLDVPTYIRRGVALN
jgi:cell division protein FtsZ